MPNDNARCGCVVLQNGALSSRKLPIRIAKSKSGKPDGRPVKKQQLQEDARASKNRSFDSGSSSSVAEQARPVKSKHEKRLNHSRRTRSAERAESHYTYIDCGSCIVGGGIRESVIPEALYVTIPDVPNASANETGNSQLSAQSRSQLGYFPSMVSPPPTYDVAISKTWQSGLPPTYEEYLKVHSKYAITRSHTPPPPWSDTTTTSVHTRRDMLASQPELREHLAHLSLSQNSERHGAGTHRHNYQDANCTSQQASREQQIRMHQRTRDSMPPRSQSASRVQQQRIATMYDDGAFCMETTALLSAFENSGCSLM